MAPQGGAQANTNTSQAMSARRLREATKTTPRNGSTGTPRKSGPDSDHEYLRRCVDPVLMPLIESLLLYQPESIYDFIHDYVDEQKSARFAGCQRTVGYAKKLTNRHKMVDFMSTSVIPVMDDLAHQILRERPSSVRGFIKEVVAARIILKTNGGLEDEQSNQSDSTSIEFQLNDRVLCRYKGRPRFFPGVITAMDGSDTFTVLYDDGKSENNVHRVCLKPHPVVEETNNVVEAQQADVMEAKSNQEPERATRLMDIVLLIVGIDGAGKTTLLSTLQGDLDKEHVPSAGFTSAAFQTETGSATFYDLGGGPTFRNVWKEYYADIHGVIYVVDSSTENAVLQSAAVLEEAMGSVTMAGKPLLVFANKRDQDTAVPEHEISELLRLEKFPNAKVVPCIAKPAVNGGAVDKRIEPALEWLFAQVHGDFDVLNDRVQHDLLEKKKLDQQRREDQRARVLRWKEEREQAQMQKHDKPSIEEAESASSTKATAENPEDAVIYCCNCSTEPAVTKCAASKWMPVCEDCATSLRSQ